MAAALLAKLQAKSLPETESLPINTATKVRFLLNNIVFLIGRERFERAEARPCELPQDLPLCRHTYSNLC
jgi:hypothetical protein